MPLLLPPTANTASKVVSNSDDATPTGLHNEDGEIHSGGHDLRKNSTAISYNSPTSTNSDQAKASETLSVYESFASHQSGSTTEEEEEKEEAKECEAVNECEGRLISPVILPSPPPSPSPESPTGGDRDPPAAPSRKLTMVDRLLIESRLTCWLLHHMYKNSFYYLSGGVMRTSVILREEARAAAEERESRAEEQLRTETRRIEGLMKRVKLEILWAGRLMVGPHTGEAEKAKLLKRVRCLHRCGADINVCEWIPRPQVRPCIIVILSSLLISRRLFCPQRI